MKKQKLAAALFLALFAVPLMLGGCGRRDAAARPTEAPGAEADTGRRDGERFDAVIVLEGMEETVHYEHLTNNELGFEMDYDYEAFVRHSQSDREQFVSRWDDPGDPENYLEVRYNPRDAETVAAAIGAALSTEYEISRDDSFMLDGAGRCIRLDASEVKGGGYMPENLQTVYIIPAGDGCRIAAVHTYIVESEGFGRRFRYMLDTFSPLASRGEKRLTDEQAVCAVRNYCLIRDPDLAGIVKAGEYPVYWDISSSDEKEIVVVFRSYTGALERYYIDPVSGETRVTEFVPGITDEEQTKDESLIAWDYWF